jgi:mono/diheme cytochrome c family protein
MSRNLLIYITMMLGLSGVMPALAADDWKVTEIFSNTNGAEQYIKLSTTSDNQHNLAGRVLRSYDAAGALVQSYTFPANLDNTQTANKSILVGTVPFSATTQLHVDYRIPENFIPTEGGEIRLDGIDSFKYLRTQLPRNGLQALNRSAAAVTASPVNLAGLTTSIVVPAPSTFTDNTGVVNLPLVAVVGEGIANASLLLTNGEPIEFMLIDGYFYDAGMLTGEFASRLEGTLLTIPSVRVGSELYEVSMTLLDDKAYVFGDLQVLGVRNVPEIGPLPPVPAPAPAVDTLALSIAAGKTQYNSQCASCHGISGQGGAGPSLQGKSDVEFQALRSYINDRMPKFNVGACVDNATSNCATDSANYIISAFQPSGSSSTGSFGYYGP